MEKSIKSSGLCEFEITETNDRKLKALAVYAQMLDKIVSEDPDAGGERLNIDGIINSLLDEVTDRRIKALKSRHGFESESEFVELMLECRDGEQALMIVQNAERTFYKKMHTDILSQIPVEDRQNVLPFDGMSVSISHDDFKKGKGGRK